MSKNKLRDEILNRLKGEKKTLPEMTSDLGKPAKAVKDTILALVSEGVVSQEDDRYFVTEGTATQPDLSELEWRVIRFLQSCSSIGGTHR